MTKNTDEAAAPCWYFPKTDCSDLFDKGELLAKIVSQSSISLSLNSTTTSETTRQLGSSGRSSKIPSSK